MTTAQREVIGGDVHRAIAQARHAPAHPTAQRSLALRPAERFILDGFGPIALASPLDGAVYSLHAVCKFSSFGYIMTMRSHEIDDWLTFIRRIILDAKLHGHKPLRLRCDRAPEFKTSEIEKRCEELGVLIELTPRERHEGIGRAERNNNTLTRNGEAMLLLCQAGPQWFLPARVYAQWILNRIVTKPNGQTRFLKYLNKIPDLNQRTPYLFWPTVAIIEDVRVPKGGQLDGSARLDRPPRRHLRRSLPRLPPGARHRPPSGRAGAQRGLALALGPADVARHRRRRGLDAFRRSAVSAAITSQDYSASRLAGAADHRLTGRLARRGEVALQGQQDRGLVPRHNRRLQAAAEQAPLAPS